jgi:hypothetical protein
MAAMLAGTYVGGARSYPSAEPGVTRRLNPELPVGAATYATAAALEGDRVKMSDLVPKLDLMEQRQRSGTEAIIRGGILAESLTPGTGFDGQGMRIIRCTRFGVTGVADYQPPIWTLIEFEAPASRSDALASELADSLLSPGWYANWNSDTETTVVFDGKIFRYPPGDPAGREEAEAYGRSVGVPESQLDWTD